VNKDIRIINSYEECLRREPDDWEEDIHGEWEAPTIPNPKCEAAPGCGEYEAPLIRNVNYKGKWKAPMIDNPAFKGVWKARQIPNPNYFEDAHPHNFMAITAVGFDLWEVNKKLGFTNIYVGTSEAAVMKWNKEHFIPKHKKQETEQKKLEPESKSELGGAAGKVTDFFNNLKESYMNLYNENKNMTIAITAVAGLIPVILIFVSCFRSSEPEEEEKEGDKKEPKVTEVIEEKETNEEKETEDSKEDKSPKEPAPAADVAKEEASAEESATAPSKPANKEKGATKRKKGGKRNPENY